MSKGKPLTPKQEAFARAFFECGNAAEAYRQAYDVSPETKDHWLHVEASQLLDHPEVALRLKALREQAERLSIFTREKAMEELNEARALALREGQAAAAIKATDSKIKLAGLEAPTRQEISSPGGGPVRLETSKRDADAFESAIAGLASRGGKRSSDSEPVSGAIAVGFVVLEGLFANVPGAADQFRPTCDLPIAHTGAGDLTRVQAPLHWPS